MSYEQREVNYVGRHFEENEELLQFLLDAKAISQELVDSWSEQLDDGERISNLLSPSEVLIPDFPELHDVDSVSGDGGMFLGYIIEERLKSKNNFDNDVKKAKQKWKNIFNEDAELNWLMQYF